MKKLTSIIITLIIGTILFMAYQLYQFNKTAIETNAQSIKSDQAILKEIKELKLQSESTGMEYHAMKEEVTELLDVLGVGEIEMPYMDVYDLATIIDNEARNQPLAGKIGVGAVVMNRVENDRFPNSIREVILSPGQFAHLRYVEVLPESLQAAKVALKGYDPTGGAIYFYNPETSTSKWIFTRKKILQIQDHVFAR